MYCKMQSSQCFFFCYKIPNLRSLETPSDMRYYDLLHMDWKHLIFFFIVFNLNLLVVCSLNRKKYMFSFLQTCLQPYSYDVWNQIKIWKKKYVYFTYKHNAL